MRITDGQAIAQLDRQVISKVVAYIVHDDHLLVFTHDHVPIEIAGVQVPAGTIEPGESPELAVVREVLEESGVHARIVRSLGVERYDVWPTKPEIHERHFFQLELLDSEIPGADVSKRWSAGEEFPSSGGPPKRWTCWWTPLARSHVLSAGFGTRLSLIDTSAHPPALQ
ncbi:MAG: NUDIX hydrolase [Agrococcus casei]|uniref:NUDIX hydrolase n=1 Tax=Agrococcus casei TaxID=343512 RepID=UPI003F8F609C